MRFAARLDQVPPYLFAEIERKIEADARRGHGRDLASASAIPTCRRLPAVDRGAPARRRRARDAPVPVATGARRLSRGRGGLLPRPLRRRDRPRDRGDSRARRQGGGRATSRSPASIPATSASRPTRAIRRTRRARCSRARSVHYLRWPRRTRSCPTSASIPADVVARANLLFFNYPNNPTGAVVADGFFERAVAFAREHDLIAVHDTSYTEVAFDGYRPPSFLATPGAKDVGVEIFSLSKGWNMTGWRIGWIAGNAEVVGALPAAEDEPRLGHVRRAPARRRRGADRGARLPAGDVRDLPAPARPDGGRARGDRDPG